VTPLFLSPKVNPVQILKLPSKKKRLPEKKHKLPKNVISRVDSQYFAILTISRRSLAKTHSFSNK